MNLTERERTILQFAMQGLSDYKIARQIKANPPSVTRSHKNAYKKLTMAINDIEWALKTGLTVLEFRPASEDNESHYSFFL
jgi:DNA-binding CsgD family transcriptional regulator